ncbi:MAG: hypothetical protein LUH08_02730 [Ruminococcus sp.]|nr:hypothetical protein [Ruminococcus sp.]
MSRFKDNPLRPYFKKLIFKMLLMLIITYIITALISFSIDIKMIIGLLAGFAFMLLSYLFMADSMYTALTTRKAHAKGIVMTSYLIRYVLLLGICISGYKLKILNPFGVLIPQFYPRIAMTIDNFSDKEVKKNADANDKYSGS